jgi:hypothetical protein
MPAPPARASRGPRPALPLSPRRRDSQERASRRRKAETEGAWPRAGRRGHRVRCSRLYRAAPSAPSAPSAPPGPRHAATMARSSLGATPVASATCRPLPVSQRLQRPQAPGAPQATRRGGGRGSRRARQGKAVVDFPQKWLRPLGGGAACLGQRQVPPGRERALGLGTKLFVREFRGLLHPCERRGLARGARGDPQRAGEQRRGQPRLEHSAVERVLRPGLPRAMQITP